MTTLLVVEESLHFDHACLLVTYGWNFMKPILDLELLSGFVHYDFLKLHYIRCKATNVSHLAVWVILHV